MKKLLAITFGILLLGGTLTFAKGEDGSFVSASSTVSRELSPNYAEINISVENKDKDAAQAAGDNSVKSTAVVNALKALLDENKGDSITTTNYTVEPQYLYKDGKSTVIGYNVRNTVKIKTTDPKSVSALIDVAMKAGATSVSGLELGYEGEDLVCNELYAQATKNAYSQAQAVAKAIGSQVTGARKITTSCSINNENTYSRMYMARMDAKGMNVAASTPVETGTLKIQATIDGKFNIK